MSQHTAHSPFQDGFAALWHDPALLAAELTWRWCFGLAAWGLAIISTVLFLDSLKISASDQLLLGTFRPEFLDGVIRRILRGSLNRFLWEQAVLILGLLLLWSFAATAGRAATLRRLVAMFATDEEPQIMRWEFAAIFELNLLRAMWSLIALAAMLVSLAAGFIMANNQRALSTACFLVFGVGLAWAFGTLLNWFFGLAPLFCIRNGVAAPDALAQSVDFFCRQSGRLFGLGIGFLTLRIVWAGTMFLTVLAPLKLVHHIAPAWIAAMMLTMMLVYFAGADLLYLVRLGAYTTLAEDDSHPVAPPEEVLPDEPLLPPDLAPLVGLA